MNLDRPSTLSNPTWLWADACLRDPDLFQQGRKRPSWLPRDAPREPRFYYRGPRAKVIPFTEPGLWLPLSCAIAFVEAGGNGQASGGTNAASAIALAAGNLVVVGTALLSSSFYVTDAVTDTAGNTYTKIVEETGTINYSLWYAYNSSAHATNVVTADYSSDFNQRSVVVVGQYSGLTTTDPLDTFASAQQNATADLITTGAFTTAQNDEVLVGVGLCPNAFGPTWSAGSGYTGRFNTTGGEGILQDKIVAAIQSGVTMSATCDFGSDTATGLVAGTFKAAGGEGGGTGQPTMRRWGGMPYVGGQGIGNSGPGRAWGRTRDGVIVPRRLAA